MKPLLLGNCELARCPQVHSIPLLPSHTMMDVHAALSDAALMQRLSKEYELLREGGGKVNA
jgi:hypothetical protein